MPDTNHIEPPPRGGGDRGGVLDWIERAGNRLPDPTTLFIFGALFVLVLSQIAVWQGWSVEKVLSQPVTEPVLTAEGEPLEVLQVDAAGSLVTTEDGEAVREAVTEPRINPDTGRVVREQRAVSVEPVGLLSRDGLFWAIESMVRNFMGFPPLGVVLVGMLGIGVAEKTGLIAALLKAAMGLTPQKLLTPSLVFIGIMSSMALDAGYIVLPPIACALYKAMGRSPLVGLAAVFSGIGAGFSANLLVTGLDPLLAGFTEAGAQILDPAYRVAATCNWWFMIASTILLTLVGWAVTVWLVEPRYERKPAEEGGPDPSVEVGAEPLESRELKGLIWGLGVALVVVGAVVAMTQIPGSPLYGRGDRFPRWVEAIVPILFFAFLLPGLAFGLVARTIRSDADLAKLMADTMKDMAPYIVLAFFAAQFVAYVNESRLGEMLAIVGGRALAASGLPPSVLLAAFVVLVFGANLFIGSASAKYAFLAPVFVPMFMQAEIAPELTQAAYRVGDSASNIIAPLNPYIIVLLVFMQKYVPKAGIGTLVSLMLPYALVFLVVWIIMLVVWIQGGWVLGPEGPLAYEPAAR